MAVKRYAVVKDDKAVAIFDTYNDAYDLATQLDKSGDAWKLVCQAPHYRDSEERDDAPARAVEEEESDGE